MSTLNHTTSLLATEGDTYLHGTLFFVSCKPDWTTAGQHATENKETLQPRSSGEFKYRYLQHVEPIEQTRGAET